MKKYILCMIACGIVMSLPSVLLAMDGETMDLPIIKKDIETGFSNGGWAADRYRHLATLDAHKGVVIADLNLLSIYRFHDHMPIRFTKELTWSINWQHEFWQHPQWLTPITKRAQQDGCWVDYATVFYWYQDSPAGFEHEPLRPLPERIKDLLKTSRASEAKAGSNP